jgi:hypothetical protein
LEKIERQRIEVQGTVANGNMTFGDALALFRNPLPNDNSLKPRSKIYREERITGKKEQIHGDIDLKVSNCKVL